MEINPKLRNDTWAKSLRGEIWFAPIRHSIADDREFYLLLELGVDEEDARNCAQKNACDIPLWHVANPVVRIERIKLMAALA
jgi:hypothetical protein